MHQSLRAIGACLLLTSAACTESMPTGPGAGAAAAPAFNEMAAAAAWDGNIRIGVVPSASSVSIGSAGDFTVTDGAGITVTGSNGAVSVSVLPSITHFRLQISCGTAEAIAVLQAAREAAGLPTSTQWNANANCWRLFIGDRTGADAGFSARVAWRNQMIAAGYAGTDSFWASWVEGVTAYRFTRSGVLYESRSPFVATSSTGLVTINGVTYRGAATVARNSTGTAAGVNVLPMEQYLYGVVPRELPPVPYGEMEAQKAQAVAARTYAMSGLGKRAADGYDLLPTTSDQVYGGYAAEHPVSTQAVDQTAGVVATYQGKLIQALFSSTSGGYTAGNEEVYGTAPVAYLRPKYDAQRGNSLEHAPDHAVFKYDRNASSLRGFKGGDYEADWSRYHRWTFEWTADEISEVVSDYAASLPGSTVTDVGRVHAINVLERGASGRVQRIEFVTDAGSFYDTRDHIRTSLKFFNATGGKSSLLSTLFYIDPVVDNKTGEVTGFVAYGGGWGHGVGLAQTGAVGMAEKGATYEEILKFYYTAIDLETAY